ncbi:MAG: peptidoglycan DD-metalloendopeptidase family protein [Pseudomonadota bacterium]
MRFLRGLSGLFLILVWVTLPLLTAAAEQNEVSEKARELEQIKTRIQHLRKQLKAVEGERSEQNSALSQTERKIGAIARRIRVVGQRLKRQQRRLASLEQERADSRLQLDRHRQVLERQVRAAYAMGRQEKVKILLNQQDPAIVSRLMVYYDYLNTARLEQMELIRQNLRKLVRIEQEITEEEQRLQQLFAREQQEKQEMETAQGDRKQIIAGLSSKLKSKGHELDGLKADEKELESLLVRLQEALADIPLDPTTFKPFKTRKGKLPWPTKGRLAASFGASREVGKLRWDGVLIAAPEGREVRAVHHGRVAFADWLRGFGLLLIIDHGEGFMSLYGHNQSLFKETGEWVEPGEVVAQVGSSGGRSSPGVYFGIRHNGKAKDPKKWCKRIKGKGVIGLSAPDEVLRIRQDLLVHGSEMIDSVEPGLREIPLWPRLLSGDLERGDEAFWIRYCLS